MTVFVHALQPVFLVGACFAVVPEELFAARASGNAS